LLSLLLCVATVSSGEGERARGTVLVVDSDAESRATTTAHLSPRYDVLSTGDAASAHALAVASQPDAVVMEVSLPGVEGPTALQHWRADDRTAAIPVLMSAHPGTAPELQVTCLARGAADFLQRPLDGRVLLARVDRAIREARDRRRLESAAQTDGLTGLANFRALDSGCARSWSAPAATATRSRWR